MRTSLSRFSGIPIPVAIALCVVCGGPWGDLPAQEAKDILFEPGSVVEGRAFGDWLLDYWNWRQETPDDKNPGFDDTLPCSAEQDSDVFFLPLPPALIQEGSRDYARSCSVPAGKPVLLPLILALVPCELCCPFAPLDGVTELTCEIRRLSPAGNLMSSFEFGFDDLVAHRETRAECFELLPPGPPFRAATDGFVVMLKPLEAGRYTIDTLAIVDTPDGPAVAATQYDIEVEEMNGETLFLRGDCNDDGEVNISDATCALDRLFAGAAAPGCLAALNTNGDGAVDIADPVFLLNFLFAGGPRLSAPFPDCGPGVLPADAALGCANPPDC